MSGAKKLGVVLAIALGLSCAAPSRDVATARVRPTACNVEGVTETVLCATVVVAEAPDADRRLDLRVIVVPARATPAKGDPILPLAGGPGQGAADLAAFYVRRFDSLREDRDIVLVDQRGTGASNGLHCPPAPSAASLVGTLFDPKRLAACRDELSRRADLTSYTTSAAAADYEQVLDALAIAQVNVIGGSYGTRLGLELARQMPGRIRTLTLEGVVPTSFTWPTTGATDAQASLDGIVAACQADEACAADFPTFAQDVDRAFARLEKAPATIDATDPATGASERVPFVASDLAYTVRGVLYGDEALALPRMFRQAAEGDFDAFARLYLDRARRLERQIAAGVHFGVYCAEDLPFVDWTRAAESAKGTRIGTYLLDQYRAACQVWPKNPVAASFREPVRSTVPALLMSGRRDPVSPARGAAEVARTLPRSRQIVWPFGGHGSDGIRARDCRTAIVREFVKTADPSHLPDGCVAGEPLPFR